MKKSIILSVLLMILVSALYRILPNRPMGFAPQIAIALFSGSIFSNNKKWSFFLPLLSMLVSDTFYQILYSNGLSNIPGFYDGQFTNYVLFMGLTCFGFFINKSKFITGSLLPILLSTTSYFIISNFIVWITRSGWIRPLTPSGLLMCYVDGLPFYWNNLISTTLFLSILLLVHSIITTHVSRVEGRILRK